MLFICYLVGFSILAIAEVFDSTPQNSFLTYRHTAVQRFCRLLFVALVVYAFCLATTFNEEDVSAIKLCLLRISCGCLLLLIGMAWEKVTALILFLLIWCLKWCWKKT